MTYNDNPELVTTVLRNELERQLHAALWAATQIETLDRELEPLQERRAELVLREGAALTLAEGIKKVLGEPEPEEEVPAGEDSGNGYTYDGPRLQGYAEAIVVEDPYDVAFGTTTTTEAPKGTTFDHRAPMFVNDTPAREPVWGDDA